MERKLQLSEIRYELSLELLKGKTDFQGTVLEIKIDDESEEVRSSKAVIEYIILVFLRMVSAYESGGSRASYCFKQMSEFNVVELS